MTQEFFTHQRTPTEGTQINEKLMDIESGDRMEIFRSKMKIEFQTAEWPPQKLSNSPQSLASASTKYPDSGSIGSCFPSSPCCSYDGEDESFSVRRLNQPDGKALLYDPLFEIAHAADRTGSTRAESPLYASLYVQLVEHVETHLHAQLHEDGAAPLYVPLHDALSME
jgi:hypothetical protein